MPEDVLGRQLEPRELLNWLATRVDNKVRGGCTVQRDAEDLMRLFADKVQDEGPVREVVCDRDHGRVVLDIPRGRASDGSLGTRITLHLSETDLVAMLQAREDLGMDIWGEPLSVIETVARLLSIYLDESLRMHGPSETGWWVYRECGFDPIAPWERGHRERRR